MSTPAREVSAKDLTHRMFDIYNEASYARLSEVLDPDVVVEWPQSKERVRGLANMKSILECYPGGPQQPFGEGMQFPETDDQRFRLTPVFKTVETASSEDTATSVVKTRYPDGSDWFVVTIAQARGGKLVYLLQYFAPLTEPPEWRAAWVEYTDA